MSSIIKRLNNPLNRFLFVMAMVEFVTVLVNCQWRVRSYNTTMLALDYKNGFTSRALLGTLYHRLNDVLPFNIISYKAVCVFAVLVTGVLACLLLFFSKKLLEKTNSRSQMKMQVLLLFFSVLVMSTFSCGYNLLRVDEFMLATSLTAVLLLVTEKAEWLVVLLSAVGVMFHQGYVLMYFNAILIIQFYYWLTRKNLKNAILFISTFITGSGLFLWFELFSRSNGTAIFEKVQREASNLSYQGIYHTTLLYHEVLGIDVSGAETDFVYRNHVQLIVYVVILIPVIYSLFRSFYRIVKKANGWIDKLKYIGLAVGSLTIVPDMLLKIDYGRWIMAVVVYYMMSILILLVLGDQLIVEEACYMVSRIKGKPWLLLYFTIVVLAVPYMDVDIDAIVKNLQRFTQFKGILFY